VYWGYALIGALGFHLMPWERFGFTFRASFVYAPAIDNLLGEEHDSGGQFYSLGVRKEF
jgi:hypothetical protein